MAFKKIIDYSASELDAAIERGVHEGNRSGFDFYKILNGIDAYMERRRRKNEGTLAKPTAEEQAKANEAVRFADAQNRSTAVETKSEEKLAVEGQQARNLKNEQEAGRREQEKRAQEVKKEEAASGAKTATEVRTQQEAAKRDQARRDQVMPTRPTMPSPGQPGGKGPAPAAPMVAPTRPLGPTPDPSQQAQVGIEPKKG